MPTWCNHCKLQINRIHITAKIYVVSGFHGIEHRMNMHALEFHLEGYRNPSNTEWVYTAVRRKTPTSTIWGDEQRRYPNIKLIHEKLGRPLHNKKGEYEVEILYAKAPTQLILIQTCRHEWNCLSKRRNFQDHHLLPCRCGTYTTRIFSSWNSRHIHLCPKTSRNSINEAPY